MASTPTLNLEAEVRQAMLDKLALSGLDATDATRLGFKPCVNGTAKELGMNFPGFKIPYFTLKGKQMPFFRYRFLVSTKKGLDALTDKKDQKYSQPPGSPVEAYFPPFLDWEKIRADHNVALLMTEGELKAACASKKGFPTIGLGGVWNFRAGAQGVDFIPSLQEFKWAGRHVFIIYDSDACTNQNVMLAQNALAKKLASLKAHPHVCKLPHGEGNVKMGLDDFIMAHGIKALEELLKHTGEWAHARELHQLNEEIIYIKDPGLIYRFDNGQKISPQAFVAHAFANRTLSVDKVILDKKGKERHTAIQVPLAPEWLKWEARAEVERITYKPGQPRIIEVPNTTFKELNTWPGWGVEPKAGVIAPWRTLLKFIFKDAGPHAMRWFEQWCAYPLQNPGTKMYTAVVFYSRVHGVGKSLVGLTLGRIYGKNFSEIDSAELDSQYNDYAENKQLVLGEEVTGGDKRGIADKLRVMLTRSEIRINVKYIPRYATPDCVNYMFNSNHPDSFFLEDTDRRFFVVEIVGAPMDPAWYRDTYDPWYKSEEGASALFYYLLNGVDMAGFDPRMPAPMTTAKAEMISDGRSDLAMWVAGFIQEKGATRTLWTAEEMLLMYDPTGKTNVTVNGMSRELKRAGAFRPLGVQQIYEGERAIRPWVLSERVPIPSGATRREKLQKIWDAERKLNEIKAKKFVAK